MGCRATTPSGQLQLGKVMVDLPNRRASTEKAPGPIIARAAAARVCTMKDIGVAISQVRRIAKPATAHSRATILVQKPTKIESATRPRPSTVHQGSERLAGGPATMKSASDKRNRSSPAPATPAG